MGMPRKGRSHDVGRVLADIYSMVRNPLEKSTYPGERYARFETDGLPLAADLPVEVGNQFIDNIILGVEGLPRLGIHSTEDLQRPGEQGTTLLDETLEQAMKDL